MTMAVENPGSSGRPQRTSPARKNSGRGINAEPTSPSDQTPNTFLAGIRADNVHTGLPGTSGYKPSPEVTEESDELSASISGKDVKHSETTLDGSAGATPASGGETVNYTNPLTIQAGNDAGAWVAHGDVSGTNDWTQAANKHQTGPALPGLGAAARSPETGVGQGHLGRNRV
jgi:hypothetical protein